LVERLEMIELLKKRRDALERICTEYKVLRLEAFGSAVKDKAFDPKTRDLDFLVEFLSLEIGEYAACYFGLLEALESLYQCHVDLVMLSAIKNKYFLQMIEPDREDIYAACL